MGRWEPDARGRLAQAAMELYGERGFEQTTVAEIAARAGLTERTFFRHFADKREVLFCGAGALQELFVTERRRRAAVRGAAGRRRRRPRRRRRRARRAARVLAGSASRDRRERRAAGARADQARHLAAALADALRGRGVPEPAATVAAEAGIAVFKVGFERWVAPDESRELGELLREALDALRSVT